MLLELVWGPPPTRKHQACHVGCDRHACLNPAHGRWGTPAQNRAESRSMLAYYGALLSLTPAERAVFAAREHPAASLLAAQGFPAWGK